MSYEFRFKRPQDWQPRGLKADDDVAEEAWIIFDLALAAQLSAWIYTQQSKSGGQFPFTSSLERATHYERVAGALAEALEAAFPSEQDGYWAVALEAAFLAWADCRRARRAVIEELDLAVPV